MTRPRSLKLVHPAKGRSAKPPGRQAAAKPPPGETFREFIRTLEKLGGGAPKRGAPADRAGEGAR